MSKKVIVTRKVTPEECNWLGRSFEVGEILYTYLEATYGCIGFGVALTQEEDKTPFFEFPRDAFSEVV